jgi:hypothetical protein
VLIHKKILSHLSTTLMLALAALNASASQVFEAVVRGAPLQYMDKGQVIACGVRLFGIVVPSSRNIGTSGFQATYILSKEGAVVTGVGFTVTGDQLSSPSAFDGGEPRRTSGIWLKADGVDATQPVSGKMGSMPSNPGTVMYATRHLFSDC